MEVNYRITDEAIAALEAGHIIATMRFFRDEEAYQAAVSLPDNSWTHIAQLVLSHAEHCDSCRSMLSGMLTFWPLEVVEEAGSQVVRRLVCEKTKEP